MYDSRKAWVAGYGPNRIDGTGPMPKEALLDALESEEGKAYGPWDEVRKVGPFKRDEYNAHHWKPGRTVFHAYRGEGLVGVLFVWQRHPNKKNPTVQERQRRSVERTRSQQAKAHESQRYRAEIQTLRAEVKIARDRARAALAAARASCKRERAATPAEVRALRAAKRAACETKKATAKKTGAFLVAKRKARIKEHRALRKILAARERVARRAQIRSSTKERRGESDDEVRGNIDTPLVPVFDAVRKQIHGNAKLSRTEAFELWVEEHPDQVIQIQERIAEKELAKAIRAQHRERPRKWATRGDVPF